jgi:FKBP-type peptidyl-prolyl cis-trans isomerase
MIINFNNDLNKTASNDFIDKKTGEFPDAVSDQGYIIVENDPSGGEVVDTTKEYKIKYTLTDIGGDTIISTVRDPESDDEFNSQIINTDDIVFPDVWSMAAKEMKVGGDYTIYAPYDLAFGEEGLSSPRSSGYIIQPFAAVVIHSKVLRQNARNTAIKKRGSKVLEDAKGQPNTVVDESGYVLTTLQEGTGKTVPAGSDVQAHYILTNSKGETVENSYQMAAQKKQPAPTFSLNSVVKGWSLAFQEMKKGGRYKLVLPPNLGYGAKGNQTILPYETLTFEIEVLDFGEEGSLVKQRPQQQGGQQQQLTKEQMEQLQKQMQQQGQQ